MAHDGMLTGMQTLTGQDWENLAEIKGVLLSFKNAHKYLEGEKYVTSS